MPTTSTGWTGSTATVVSQGDGDVAWTNHNNAAGTPDATFATSTPDVATTPSTDRLVSGDTPTGEGFDFSIPATATILGFQARTWLKSAPTSTIDLAIRFDVQTGSGSYIGDPKVIEDATITATAAYYTVGGSTDLWGISAATLLSIINSTFRVTVQVYAAIGGPYTVSCGSIECNVWYSTPGGSIRSSRSSRAVRVARN